MAIMLASALMVQTPSCASWTEIVKGLGNQYHEVLNGQGVMLRNGLLMELYVSTAGTWTILMTDRKRACIVMVGDGWEAKTKGQSL
mgnify:CR=1 FL=1